MTEAAPWAGLRVVGAGPESAWLVLRPSMGRWAERVLGVVTTLSRGPCPDGFRAVRNGTRGANVIRAGLGLVCSVTGKRVGDRYGDEVARAVRHRIDTRTGKRSRETVHVITDLTSRPASPRADREDLEGALDDRKPAPLRPGHRQPVRTPPRSAPVTARRTRRTWPPAQLRHPPVSHRRPRRHRRQAPHHSPSPSQRSLTLPRPRSISTDP